MDWRFGEAEVACERSVASPEPHRPEKRNPLARMTYDPRAPRAANRIRRQPHAVAHQPNQLLERASRPGQLKQLSAHLLDERRGAEDPLIGAKALAALLDGRRVSPALSAASQPTAVEIARARRRSIVHEFQIMTDCRAPCAPEAAKNVLGILPLSRDGPDKRCMSAVPIVREHPHVADDRGNRVEVDVANELKKIRLFFAKGGLVAVLKEVACTIVS
ncbi:MAG: hypothetical protein ACREQJ_05880, partial [Candidatus Binatia bacterium]